MVNKMFKVLLMSGVIAAFPAATQASPAEEQEGLRASHQEQTSIVGSWIGVLDNGERILMSFTSDGIEFSSVQGAVKLISRCSRRGTASGHTSAAGNSRSPIGSFSTTSRRETPGGPASCARC